MQPDTQALSFNVAQIIVIKFMQYTCQGFVHQACL